MKTIIIALSATALIAAATAAVAQDGPGKTHPHHRMISQAHYRGASGYAPRHEMQTTGSNNSQPGISPDSPDGLGRYYDRNLESSKQAGGGSGM